MLRSTFYRSSLYRSQFFVLCSLSLVRVPRFYPLPSTLYPFPDPDASPAHRYEPTTALETAQSMSPTPAMAPALAGKAAAGRPLWIPQTPPRAAPEGAWRRLAAASLAAARYF